MTIFEDSRHNGETPDRTTDKMWRAAESSGCRSPVFIVGVHRRCGSNFLGDSLRLCPALQEPKPPAEDYLLEFAQLLDQYVTRTMEKRYKKWFKQEDEYRACGERLVQRLGDGLLAFLCDYLEPGRRLLTRTPDPDNLDRFFHFFAGARLILLIRDGRDIVESSHRSWPSEPYASWMKAWAAGARAILDFMSGPGRECEERWKLVRYEDLLERRSALEGVLEFLGIAPADYPWDQLEQLPVRGSSVHRGGKRELNWDPVQKPKDFKPVGRWKSWGRWRRWQFKRLAGKELIDLGYVADNQW